MANYVISIIGSMSHFLDKKREKIALQQWYQNLTICINHREKEQDNSLWLAPILGCDLIESHESW